MISVEVTYFNNIGKKKNNDFFIYTSFVVEGHANNGTSSDCEKVCAGVSACVIGVRRLLDTTTYEVTYDKGLFKARLRTKAIPKDQYIEIDSTYALNTLLCQLYDLSMMYPSQFSKFDMVEIKENNEYVRQNKQKPKPFRKRKRVDIYSSDEEPSC